MPINGVIFDFHATLVDGGDPDRWINAAFRHLADAGSVRPKLRDTEFETLSEHLYRIWQHAHTIDPNSERDLSQARHQDVFTRTVALCPGIKPDLVAALYAVMQDQWVVFDDTLPVLRELKSRGVKIAVLSNIGIDIRDCLDRAGVSDLLDIYARALDLLDLPGSQTLMVGDSPQDDVGGVILKIRTLILPRTEGPVHGLGAVLRMVGNDTRRA